MQLLLQECDFRVACANVLDGSFDLDHILSNTPESIRHFEHEAWFELAIIIVVFDRGLDTGADNVSRKAVGQCSAGSSTEQVRIGLSQPRHDDRDGAVRKALATDCGCSQRFVVYDATFQAIIKGLIGGDKIRSNGKIAITARNQIAVAFENLCLETRADTFAFRPEFLSAAQNEPDKGSRANTCLNSSRGHPAQGNGGGADTNRCDLL
ncbi:hypothetical protein [Rhizobium sp. RU20A]|uniref:hypothetical protein n=1 Tax=Rhizobium sp. RU20A TaxID=1907412 RepID=UPI00165F2DB0|nr:hypothetical protein [Rhizobium sp. RU20A]